MLANPTIKSANEMLVKKLGVSADGVKGPFLTNLMSIVQTIMANPTFGPLIMQLIMSMLQKPAVPVVPAH